MATRTEFNRFFYSNLLKAAAWLILVVLAVIAWNRYLPEDWIALFDPITSRPLLMYIIFLASETFIGILPPELFIGWALTQDGFGYLPHIVLLSLISYSAGLIAFGAGRILRNVSFIRRRLESQKALRYAGYYEKWGGIVIIIAAVTPLPFATISMISGAFRYRTVTYLLYSSARFARFFFEAWLIWAAAGV